MDNNLHDTSSHTPLSNDKSAPVPAKRRRNPWLRVLKWLGIMILSVVLLLIAVVGAAVWILTPERLTPIVEKYATEYIDGEVKIDRVELTFWSTFPRLQLDVDSLRVISHTLRNITPAQRAAIPSGADTVVTVGSFSGGVNVLKALTGTIALHDITINHPVVTIVDVTPTLSNYSIFPVSDTKDTTATVIPDIQLSRFKITGTAPIRYVSLSDSIDFKIKLTATSVDGEDAPGYKLNFAADASTTLGDLSFDNLRIGMGGDVVWNHLRPYVIELRKFQAGVNDINAIIDAKLDFEDNMSVNSLEFVMPIVAFNSVVALIPKELRGGLNKLNNNLKVGLTAKLTKPYVPSRMRYPSMEMSLTIPEGQVSYEQLKLSKLALDLDAVIDGENLDASKFNLKRLVAIGEGVGFELNGVATNVISDPRIEGNFRGGIEFSRIPKRFLAAYNVTASGHLRGDADFRLRQSYLSRVNFHRIKLDGYIGLKNFRVTVSDFGANAYVRDANLKFGTSSTISRGNFSADSLMTASLNIDTIAVILPGLDAQGRLLRLGVGCKNIATSSDTTIINPIGANGHIGFFSMFTPEDSTRIRLRDINVRGQIRRYRDNNRVPQLDLLLDAGRMRYSDVFNRVSLRNTNLDLTIHPTPPRVGRRMKAAMDSISAANPGLHPDSVYAMARRVVPRRQRALAADSSVTSTHMDFELDSETKSILRKWRASGHLKAERARLMTPYFPLRNRLRDLDMTFNNDSIIVRNTKYNVGASDFTIDGSITNLTRALTSRSGRQPLRVNLRLTSDTIDVNQIAAATFAGAAFAEKERQGLAGPVSDSENDEDVQASIANAADSTETGPLLIPTNIEATVRMAARNVLYADFIFHNFRGTAEIFDGALNLRNLSARTDIGGIDLTALYQGLTPDSLSFAFGMQVRDFHLGRFMELMPQLDTIMPLLRDVKGIVNAEVAATSRLTPDMDLEIPTMNAAVSIAGDSLVLVDAETFRKIGKWLLFKHKERNVIDHMDVKLVVKDAQMELFPFIFNIDRYKLGVFGSNDLDLNFKYHVAVLKSPIPFKFGINVSGNPDKMKIRLGGAKVNEKKAAATVAIADNTRINLLNQIENVFRRGVRRAGKAGGVRLDMQGPSNPSFNDVTGDTISHADSLLFIREGLIPAPPRPDSTLVDAKNKKGNKKKKK